MTFALKISFKFLNDNHFQKQGICFNYTLLELDTKEDALIFICLHQILTLPSNCQSRNEESGNIFPNVLLCSLNKSMQIVASVFCYQLPRATHVVFCCYPQFSYDVTYCGPLPASHPSSIFNFNLAKMLDSCCAIG